MAESSEHCLVCCETYNSTSTNTDTDTGANSSTSLCACERKQLYPKIHFCGNIIWICSTCIIKGKKCNHCNEDLLESQADTKENLKHNQLFTDLIMVEKRKKKILCQNEHIYKTSDLYCTDNVQEIKKWTEKSVDNTKMELNNFIKKLELNEIECKGHLDRLNNQKETINGEITETFCKLRHYLVTLENELKTSVEVEYKKQHDIIQRQNDRMTAHKTIVKRVHDSPPNAAFFDMTHTLAAIVNSIEKDIPKLKDVNVQKKFQERREDLEEAIKILEDMRFVSRESSHGNVMSTKISKATKRTLYSNARSVSGPRGSINIAEPGMSHETENVVYAYTCTKCHMLYVGETGRQLKIRDKEHRKPGGIIYEHKCEQDRGEKQNHFVVSCVRKGFDDKEQRHMMERLIMLKLGTLEPDGLNKNLPPSYS